MITLGNKERLNELYIKLDPFLMLRALKIFVWQD